MDPLTLSGAFATVVGLLANFKAERSGSDLNAFMSWLRERHQEQLADAITANRAVGNELSVMLAGNHDELLKRLEELHQQIRNVAIGVQGFSGLVTALSSGSPLSTQAKSVLLQIVESKAEYVMERKLSTGQPTQFIFISGAVGEVQYDEPNFINEDLEQLVSLQFLRVEYASKGSRKFSATRAGVEHVRSDA